MYKSHEECNQDAKSFTNKNWYATSLTSKSKHARSSMVKISFTGRKINLLVLQLRLLSDYFVSSQSQAGVKEEGWAGGLRPTPETL